MARIADDLDFSNLKSLVDDNDGWSLELNKGCIDVFTKPVDGCNFHMVKIHSLFENISPETLFDVLHDPDYRKVWDSHMLASEEIGIINVNNDIGYYAVNCPPPLKPRDFVLMRSWLDTGPRGEQMLISRSVAHLNYPPKKGFVRATSHLTGFVLRPHGASSCVLSYVTHCDPQGALPPWLVNKVTQTFGPRMIKDLQRASLGYEQWKMKQTHFRKPWRFPEEMDRPRISLNECLPVPLYNEADLIMRNVQGSENQPTTNTLNNNKKTTTKQQQQQNGTPKKRKFF